MNCPGGAREAALGRRPLRVHGQNHGNSGPPQSVAALPRRVQRRRFQVRRGISRGPSGEASMRAGRCGQQLLSGLAAIVPRTAARPHGVLGHSPGGFSPLFAGEKGPAGGMTSPQSQANNVEAAPARRTQSVTAGAEPSEAGGPMWQKVNCPRGAREAALGHRPLRGCVDRGRGTFGRPGGKMKIHEDFISHPGGTMV